MRDAQRINIGHPLQDRLASVLMTPVTFGMLADFSDEAAKEAHCCCEFLFRAAAAHGFREQFEKDGLNRSRLVADRHPGQFRQHDWRDSSYRREQVVDIAQTTNPPIAPHCVIVIAMECVLGRSVDQTLIAFDCRLEPFEEGSDVRMPQ